MLRKVNEILSDCVTWPMEMMRATMNFGFSHFTVGEPEGKRLAVRHNPKFEDQWVTEWPKKLHSSSWINAIPPSSRNYWSSHTRNNLLCSQTKSQTFCADIYFHWFCLIFSTRFYEGMPVLDNYSKYSCNCWHNDGLSAPTTSTQYTHSTLPAWKQREHSDEGWWNILHMTGGFVIQILFCSFSFKSTFFDWWSSWRF